MAQPCKFLAARLKGSSAAKTCCGVSPSVPLHQLAKQSRKGFAYAGECEVTRQIRVPLLPRCFCFWCLAHVCRCSTIGPRLFDRVCCNQRWRFCPLDWQRQPPDSKTSYCSPSPSFFPLFSPVEQPFQQRCPIRAMCYRSEVSPSPTERRCAPPDLTGRRRFSATYMRWAALTTSTRSGKGAGLNLVVAWFCRGFRGWSPRLWPVTLRTTERSTWLLRNR